MATQLLLSTTGVDVTFADLGNRSFTHPTVDFDLFSEYPLEYLRDSDDLLSALVGGDITLVDESGASVIALTDFYEAPIHNNWSAVTVPTVNDDASLGYRVGSRWVNTTTRTAYSCVDNTVGAAVWYPTNRPNVTDFVFASSDANQPLIAINTYQNLTFDLNNFVLGWSHTPGTGIFTCNRTAAYFCTLSVTVEKSGSGSPEAAIRATFNGAEITGSHFGMDITSNNTAFALSRAFYFSAVAGQNLIPQWAASNLSVFVTTAPNPAGSTAISAGITIAPVT